MGKLGVTRAAASVSRAGLLGSATGTVALSALSALVYRTSRSADESTTNRPNYIISKKTKLMLAVILPLLALSLSPAVATAPKPHILMVLVDDYGWADIGYHRSAGYKEVQTPTIDSLVAEGVALDRHYVYRCCSPTRSSLQSGRLPVHVNEANIDPDYHNPKDNVSGFSAIPRNMTGIASKMQQAGYLTHMVGKWDAGMATPDHTPLGRGYQTSFHYFHHANDYYTKTTGACNMTNATTGKTHAVPMVDLWATDHPANQWALEAGLYEEEAFAKKGLDVIRGHNASDTDAPLFLFYSFHIVHTPYEVPDEWFDKFSFIAPTDKHSSQCGSPKGCRQIYHAMVNYMDTVLGKLTAALKQNHNMWADTLMVLSADNGGPIHRGANNYPLKGGKLSSWEGGTRVNAFASGGFVPHSVRGTVQRGYIHIADWYATFCALAGVDPTDHRALAAHLPPVDGLNVWPLVSGRNSTSPRTRMHLDSCSNTHRADRESNKTCGTLISGDWKVYVQERVGMSYWPGPTNPNSTMNGTDPSTFHQNCNAGCLYNIKTDPSELSELSLEQPSKLKLMIAELADAQKTVFNPDRGVVDHAACKQAVVNGGVWGPWLP